jgi:hypothetical protein
MFPNGLLFSGSITSYDILGSLPNATYQEQSVPLLKEHFETLRSRLDKLVHGVEVPVNEIQTERMSNCSYFFYAQFFPTNYTLENQQATLEGKPPSFV